MVIARHVAVVLSVVRNPEVVASRRLQIHYVNGSFNWCFAVCPL